MNWQPIETAPKDGRQIWAFATGDDGYGHSITWQGVINWMNFMLVGDQGPCWSGLPPCKHVREEFSDGSAWNKPVPATPTHWQPLPEPPK